METTRNKASGLISRALSVALTLGLSLTVFAATAAANTGAGTVILNVAQVDYDDAAGISSFSATSSASVTVNLVASAPNVTFTPAAAQTVGSGTTATYTYTVTATANGSDTYNISNSNVFVNLNGAETVIPTPASLTLGASVIYSHPAFDQIEIPAGSGANLANGNIVVINLIDYTITNVSGAGTTPSHTNFGAPGHTTVGVTTPETRIVITLAAGPVSGTAPDFVTTPEVGTQVGERATFTLDVTGTTAAAGDGTATVDTTLTSVAAPAVTFTHQTVTTFQANFVTILKEVRNVTAVGAFGATTSADPLDILEYRISMTNTSGSNATNVYLTDPLPAYTTYQAGTTLLNGAVVADVGADSQLTQGLGVQVNDSGAAPTAGVIRPAPDNTAIVLFQVQVN